MTSILIGFTRRTSFSAAKAMLRRGYKLVISDTVVDAEKISLLEELSVYGEVINALGRQDPALLDENDIDLIMPSPGVPLDIPLIREARKRGLSVLGDIEIFYNEHPEARYIGITGTDGKTTTTTLVHLIFSKETHALLGGNIGIPIFEYDNDNGPDSFFILELSSYQLEAIKNFRPSIAAILNFAEDHLDRYGSIEPYFAAKKRIFMNQKENDFAILNYDSPYSGKFVKDIKPRVLYFSSGGGMDKCDIYIKEGYLFYNGERYINRNEILLKGLHNAENAMAAILISKAAGISDNAILSVLTEFAGLPHRLELVRRIDGVDYYNDSKSTTVNSLEKALLSFDKPIILIAGGRDKGLDFSKIKKLAALKLKKLVLIGEAAGKIRSELEFQTAFISSDMHEAVNYAKKNASPGDVVLLSPGCASFDMFKNFEERGDVFREIVQSF